MDNLLEELEAMEEVRRQPRCGDEEGNQAEGLRITDQP